MTNTSDYNFEDYGRLPQSVINAAAAEYITRFLMPELQGFMAMAIEALAHDCEIEAAEAEQVIIERLQAMTQRLKPGQYTVNHAAILFRLWGLFEDLQDEPLFEVNEDLAKYQLMDCQPFEQSPAAEGESEPAEDKPLQWHDWQSDTDLTGDNGAN